MHLPVHPFPFIAPPIALLTALTAFAEPAVPPSGSGDPAPWSRLDAATFEVLVDQPEEGVVWALGRSYKARFDRDGTTFFPHLGPEAERHEPLHFELQSVRVGPVEIQLEDAIPPSLAADRSAVVFARGALEESYALGAHSIEQLFRFETPPLAKPSGAMEIRVRADGEHTRSRSECALRMRGELSDVSYSQAVAVDALGRRTSLTTAWDDGDIVIRVDADTLASARYPLVIDPVIQSFQIFQDPAQDAFPDLAVEVGSHLYLAVWERTSTGNDRDVLGMFFTPELGPIGGMVPIDLTTERWSSPRVASNRSLETFLVVASRGPFGSEHVAGRSVEPFSLTPGPIVDMGPGRSPDVGGDSEPLFGSLYAVAFERAGDIVVQFLSGTGTALVGSPLIFNSLPTFLAPTISKSAGPVGSERRWNVVFQANVVGSPSEVRAVQIRPDGTITMFGETIAPSTEARVNPTVSTILERPGEPLFVVSHESITPAGSEVHLSLMRGEEELQTLSLAELDGSSTADSRFNADVACDGENVVVAYQELAVSGAADVLTSSFRVEEDQLILVEARVPLANGPSLEGVPSVLAIRDGGGSHGRFPTVYNSFVGAGEIRGQEYVVPAPNDHCEQAIVIGLGTHRGTLVGATLDVMPACGFQNPDPSDVWYRLVSPVTGRVTISTCGTADLFGGVVAASTVLSIYDDRTCPVDPASETCSSDSAPVFCDIHGDDAILEFDAVAGSEYLLRVGTKLLTRREDFLLDVSVVAADPGVTFCFCTHRSACGNNSSTAGCLNGSGIGAVMEGGGTRSIGAGDLVLTSRDMPSNVPGLLFAGSGQLSLPFFNGRRCASGPFVRFPVRAADSAGVSSEPGTGVSSIAARVGASPGQTSRFQWWYRDGAGPCGTAANYSSGFAVTWLP